MKFICFTVISILQVNADGAVVSENSGTLEQALVGEVFYPEISFERKSCLDTIPNHPYKNAICTAMGSDNELRIRHGVPTFTYVLA